MKKRILCFGDSNTWGAVPNTPDRFPEDVRWTGILAKELGDDYQVIEEGLCGRTTVFTDVIEGRLSGLEYFIPCLDSHSPLDLVILMLGTNDLKTRFNIGPKCIADGLHRYYNAVRTSQISGDGPKVLLLSPIMLSPEYKQHYIFGEMFGDDAVERSAGFGAAFREAAERFGWEFLDAAKVASASPEDGLHMGAEDHAKLGSAVAAKVKEIL